MPNQPRGRAPRAIRPAKLFLIEESAGLQTSIENAFGSFEKLHFDVVSFATAEAAVDFFPRAGGAVDLAVISADFSNLLDRDKIVELLHICDAKVIITYSPGPFGPVRIRDAERVAWLERPYEMAELLSLAAESLRAAGTISGQQYTEISERAAGLLRERIAAFQARRAQVVGEIEALNAMRTDIETIALRGAPAPVYPIRSGNAPDSLPFPSAAHDSAIATPAIRKTRARH